MNRAGAYKSPKPHASSKNPICGDPRAKNPECYNPPMSLRLRSLFLPTRRLSRKFSPRRITLIILLLAALAPTLHSASQTQPSAAASITSQAQSAASRGDWSTAATLYGQAAKLSPRDATLRIHLGAALAKSRRFADAIAAYQDALSLSPRNATAEVGLAEAYRAVHNFEEARRILERAIREHPRSPQPLAVLGDIDLELQTYDAAIRYFSAALALDPANTDTRNRLVSAYKSKGDATSALAQVAKVLARDPQNALAVYLRAEIEADHNQDDQALADAEKAVSIQPQSRPGRILLGKILVRTPPKATPEEATQRCRRASDTLQSVAADHPDDSQTLFLLSRAYRCAGLPDQAQEALAAFERASQNDRSAGEGEKQARHLVQQANDRAMQNDLHGALDLLQQALEKNPNDSAAYSQLAKLYFSAGDIPAAATAISKALALDPYQPDFLYVQGKILERQGKFDEALAAFRQTSLVNPQESDAYFEMGAIYQHLNDRPRAVAAYKKAVALSPDDPDYRRALASLTANSSER
jgi:tetratricopeptide (TPR) repeat protein